MAIKIDEATQFQPNFGTDGLIGCITQSAHDGRVLMFAWMNRESLELTLKTGEMHYWSRSRQQLWHKGATSGNVQKLIELRIDCDQDCLLAIVEAAPSADEEVACHTNRRSCFYRVIKDKEILEFKD